MDVLQVLKPLLDASVNPQGPFGDAVGSFSRQVGAKTVKNDDSLFPQVAPRMFKKRMNAALSPLRLSGMRILNSTHHHPVSECARGPQTQTPSPFNMLRPAGEHAEEHAPALSVHHILRILDSCSMIVRFFNRESSITLKFLTP